jgi:hypothetical protein
MIALPETADGAIAVGWATVELDRAARELSHLLATGAAFAPADASVTLGARCRSGPAAEAGLWIALLEPETEGRLAGTLARDGEGWAASWVLAETAGATRTPALAAARPGPFGPERLVLGRPAARPHRLVLEAVPSPP